MSNFIWGIIVGVIGTAVVSFIIACIQNERAEPYEVVGGSHVMPKIRYRKKCEEWVKLKNLSKEWGIDK